MQRWIAETYTGVEGNADVVVPPSTRLRYLGCCSPCIWFIHSLWSYPLQGISSGVQRQFDRIPIPYFADYSSTWVPRVRKQTVSQRTLKSAAAAPCACGRRCRGCSIFRGPKWTWCSSKGAEFPPCSVDNG